MAAIMISVTQQPFELSSSRQKLSINNRVVGLHAAGVAPAQHVTLIVEHAQVTAATLDQRKAMTLRYPAKPGLLHLQFAGAKVLICSAVSIVSSIVDPEDDLQDHPEIDLEARRKIAPGLTMLPEPG